VIATWFPTAEREGDRDVKRVANYLQAHNPVRITVLGVSFSIASIALYIGIAVYALTLGPKAVGDYMRDRFIAGCLIALTVLVNVGTASVLTRRGGGFMPRFLLSVLVTVGGTVLVFGMIVVRVMLVKAWSAR
jgi:hypothetical protein